MGEPVAFGDRALRFALPEGVDRAALLGALRAIDGVHDVVLGEATGAAYFAGDGRAVAPAVKDALATARPRATTAGRAHVVPVVYDGADLDAVAQAIGTSVADVVARHTHAEVEVAMMGFVPGFAYLRGVDPALHLPRRAPRTRVPKGSVAIAAGYTAIYPFASPGGWNLLGRAAFAPFDDRGATLALGDRVRFTAVDALAAPPAPTAVAPQAALGLHLIALTGPALVVDGGRLGHAHEGVPPSGPLVPRAMAAVNRAVGNAGSACAIELYGAITVRADAPLTLADRHGARTLATGETYVATRDPSARVAYLAVQGGFDVPRVLGARTTLLVAGLGGHHGRWLARGDTLPIGEVAASTREIDDGDEDGELIRILPGPDHVDGALAAMTRATFRVAPSSDRTGTRLEGPTLPIDPEPARASTPMVRGAIQLTPSGLVVLGPDHPTTGGYPVVAVVAHASLNRLFSRPLGGAVRFNT